MCIAIYKPASVLISRSVYEQCFESNSDGAGFAYAENGQLYYEKGFFNFEEFFAAFSKHEMRECIVHFRIKTAGSTDKANCHPWVIRGKNNGPSFAVIHNGILSYRSTKEKSDTGHFVHEVMAPVLKRDPDFLDTNAGMFLFEETIGSTNKMVIMRNDGRVWILNEKHGTYDDKVWYSNYTYRMERWTGHFGSSGRWQGRGYDDDFPDWPVVHHNGASGNVTQTKLLTPPQPIITPIAQLKTTILGADGKPADGSSDFLITDQHYRMLQDAGRKIVEETLGDDATLYSPEDLLVVLRDQYRDAHPSAYSLDDHEIDIIVIQKGFY